MEEKKAKTVNLSKSTNDKGEVLTTKKLTYEQLNDACNQLWQQNRQLLMKNKELEQIAINKRLDYLFKILEFSNKFSNDFIVACVNEIEDAISITEQSEDKGEK